MWIPFIGKYSLMKICTGTLKGDTVVYNVNKDTEEKIGKLYVLRGKEQIEVPELKAGDIGAVAKLTVTQTGDTMAVRTAPIVYHKPQISTPYTYMAYKAVNKGEDDKVSTRSGPHDGRGSDLKGCQRCGEPPVAAVRHRRPAAGRGGQQAAEPL